MQTRGPYINVPLQIKGSYIDKGLIQTRGFYRQRTPIDALQFLQTRAPTDKGPLQTKCPYRSGAPTDKGPLQTVCNFYR